MSLASVQSEVAVAAVSRCKPGDLWALGEHRLLCGDSTDPEQLRRLTEGQKVGLFFADPPYGINVVRKNGKLVGGKARAIGTGAQRKVVEAGTYIPIIGDDSTETAKRAYHACASLCKRAAHIWWGGQYYADALPPSGGWIVWDKQTTGTFGDGELAWTNRKGAVRFFRHMWNGLMKASERGQKRVHPTQKPVALAVWCFDRYGSADDLTLDPFAGSGISILAGEQMGRRVRGCEIAPYYCDVIIDRWERMTGKAAVLLESH